MREAVAAGALLALLPWLGPKYVAEAVPVLAAMGYWLARRGRGMAGLVAAEVFAGSVLVYVTVNEALYGGPTPYSAGGGEVAAAAFPSGYVDRLPRLAALWLDREYGIVRWAPVLLLAVVGAWALWRSRRDHVARAVPERRDAENAAALALLVCLAAYAVAIFASPTMFGFWFPPRHLVVALPAAAVLVAWGVQRAPRAATALGLVSVATAASLVVGLHAGAVDGWVRPHWSVPYGPLDVVLPLYGVDSAWADVVDGVLVAGLALVALREWRSWRQTVGTTRRAYSG
jgi:hypothetical protein